VNNARKLEKPSGNVKKWPMIHFIGEIKKNPMMIGLKIIRATGKIIAKTTPNIQIETGSFKK
jgi:hypothetical protein